jgi:hypothetical protein
VGRKQPHGGSLLVGALFGLNRSRSQAAITLSYPMIP